MGTTNENLTLFCYLSVIPSPCRKELVRSTASLTCKYCVELNYIVAAALLINITGSIGSEMRDCGDLEYGHHILFPCLQYASERTFLRDDVPIVLANRTNSCTSSPKPMRFVFGVVAAFFAKPSVVTRP